MAMEMETNLENLDEESLYSPRRLCCCCCFPFSSRWDRLDGPVRGERSAGGGGARAVMMKAREWSELAAGPRWKNFLRRFGRNPNQGRPARFQYDPLSYTLNFDEGPGGGESPKGGNAGGHRDFTARFAAPPARSTAEPLVTAAAAGSR